MPSKHGQLANTLRMRIADGRYGPSEELPGGKLPSEAELEQETGFSRTTVRAALTTLQNEGLIRSESGSGYFVRKLDHLIYRPQDDFRRGSTTPESSNLTGARQVRPEDLRQDIAVEIVGAVENVARRLGVAEGEDVALRRRDTYLGDEPYQLVDSYYPLDVVAGTEVMSPRDIPAGVNRLLADRGFAQVRAFDEIWPRMPTPDEVRRLALGPGVAVAEHVITGLTAEGRAVRMVRAIIPGDRSVITYDRVHPDVEGA